MSRWTVIATVVGVMAAGVGFAVAWYESFGTAHSSSLSSVTSYLVAGGTAAIALGTGISAFLAYRSSRSRRKYRTRISGLVSASPGAVQEAKPEELVVARYIVDRDAAERRLAPYLPANPRRAKRLINHERLYRQIGESCGIFGGAPQLTYDHMARWALIVEEWPRLAAALTRDPSIIEELERAVDIGRLQEKLAAQVPGVRATTELFDLLCGNEGVRLSPVLARLVRFEPSSRSPAGAPAPLV